MTAADPAFDRSGLISLRTLSAATLSFVVFLSGFVIYEPAPYELILVAVIPIWFLSGLQLRGAFGPLPVLLLVYMAGGFLATSQTHPSRFMDGQIYMGVSLFLAASSVWYAALLAEDWRRIRIIERAYLVSAILVATAGILGYFRLIPGAEAFLLYGRAKGTFQDPNVFGPFLVLPTLILARRLLTGPLMSQPGAMLGFLILVLAIFLSFSRGAWGMLALGLPMLAIVTAATAPTNRQRLRLLGTVMIGLVVLIGVIAVAASIPAVYEILVQRAKLFQEYDSKTGDELGRFARHWAGFAMAMEKPFGIGPLEFDKLYIEATHNTYLKALMEYGWIGFVSYVALVIWTLAKALPLVLQPRPWQGFAQCVVIAFILHLLIGWIIDTDHWRHFYMVIGLIWGLIAVERYTLSARYAGV